MVEYKWNADSVAIFPMVYLPTLFTASPRRSPTRFGKPTLCLLYGYLTS